MEQNYKGWDMTHLRFDETFPDERYIRDKIILKISAQTDNPFKSYDHSTLAW